MWLVPAILSLSILLQLASAAAGLRLIRLSGCHRPWIFLSMAIVLMAFRRIISLFTMLRAGAVPSSALGPELVALAISILMLTGLVALGPTFRAICAMQDTSSRRIREGEIMLLESHHHAKNDLQMLASLVRLQAGGAPRGPLRALLLDLDSRIRSFSLLHEEIYSAASDGVDVTRYLTRLSKSVISVCATESPGIELELRLDPLEADQREMLFCGLVVNEALTNACKHAFPRSAIERPRVVIASRTDHGRRTLEISDNGVGMDADCQSSDSYGLVLMRALAEESGRSTAVVSPVQPDAQRAPGDGPGTAIVVRF